MIQEATTHTSTPHNMKRKKNLHFTNFFLLSGAWEGISFESEIILIAKIKKKTLKKTCLIICL